MKFISSLITAIALGAAGTHAITAETLDFLGDKYEIVDLTWDVPFNATHSMAVNGTVEDVFRALEELNPDHFAAIMEKMANNSLLAAPLVSKRDGEGRDTGIAPRSAMAFAPQAASYMASLESTNQFPHKPTVGFCHFRNSKPMNSQLVWQGIYHLDAIPGTPRSQPGPNMCGMVSCSWGTGITWCNDNTHDFVLQSYKEIAAAAAMIIRDCENFDHDVVGQQFFADNWNVIIHNAKC